MSDTRVWKESRYKSNLWLQVFLFSNVYLAVLWAIISGWYLIYNTMNFGKIQMILSICGYIFTVPAEVLRLYLGYSGNLRGKISDLSGFWIMSTLIQLPIHIYFTYTNESFVLLRFLQYFMIIWIVIEIPFGAYALRKLSIYQAQLYRMKLLSKRNSNPNNKY